MKKTNQVNKLEEIRPQVEVRVSESWLTAIQFCQTIMPYGKVSMEIVNGQPDRFSFVPELRFSKPNSIPGFALMLAQGSPVSLDKISEVMTNARKIDIS